MKALFFDLDGTLLNTLEDIKDALNDALEEISLPLRYSFLESKRLIGNGAEILMHRALGPYDDPEHFVRLKEAFLPRYLSYQGRSTVPYPGVVEMLNELKEDGWLLFIITNKPDEMAQDIVSRTLPKDLFTAVLGHKEGTPVKPNVFLIDMAVRDYNVMLPDSYFVGDSMVDVQTAKNAGIPCIFCEYGYGSLQEGEMKKDVHVARTAKEIATLIKECSSAS